MKWAGGKTRLLPELVARRPRTFRRYFEPFLGGAAFFFHLNPARSFLTDRNRDLIEMYRCVAEDVEAVIKKLTLHRQRHSEEHYYEVRERWNGAGRPWSRVERAAAFIYLNKTCYNGLWRVNRRGLFNVPVGRYTSPQIFDATTLRIAADALRHAQLEAGDYRDGVTEARAGDFVYFDPPYHPLNATARFTSYTADDFGPEDQDALAQLVRELYQSFNVAQVLAPRAINSKSSKRGAVAELLITNY